MSLLSPSEISALHNLFTAITPNLAWALSEQVNQEIQRLGIESYLREVYSLKPADTELWITTNTTTHARSLRLKEIQYRVDAVRNGAYRLLFEASIEIADSRLHPRVKINATPFVKAF